MAAGFVSSPGTKYGPCEKDCIHVDCQHSRNVAGSKCQFCDKSIGYEKTFYMREGFDNQYDHAVCVEEYYEAQS